LFLKIVSFGLRQNISEPDRHQQIEIRIGQTDAFTGFAGATYFRVDPHD
jgi:hypothetical protein